MKPLEVIFYQPNDMSIPEKYRIKPMKTHAEFLEELEVSLKECVKSANARLNEAASNDRHWDVQYHRGIKHAASDIRDALMRYRLQWYEEHMKTHKMNCPKCNDYIAGIDQMTNRKYIVKFNCQCGYAWEIISDSSEDLARMFDIINDNKGKTE